MWQKHKVELEKRNREILAMWSKGITSGQIATALSISRNQVMGVVHRAQKLGLVVRHNYDRALAVKKPPVARLPKQPPLTTVAPVKLKKEPEMPKKPLEPPKSPEELRHVPKPKRIMDLGMHDCRWILPDKFYCGQFAPKPSEPWCKEHRAIVYQAGTSFARKRV